MRKNQCFSRQTIGSYVQVYQGSSKEDHINLDLNFFEGVRNLEEAKTLYAILGEAITFAESET